MFLWDIWDGLTCPTTLDEQMSKKLLLSSQGRDKMDRTCNLYEKKHFAFWNKSLWTCPLTSVLKAAKTKHIPIIPTFPGPSKPTAKPRSTSFSPPSSAAVATCWQTAIITAQFAASDNQCWRPTNCFPPISSLGVTDGEGLRVAAAQRY